MSERHEYKFVRLEQSTSRVTGISDPSASASESYQEVVHEHARQGWRLVQIFAPGLTAQTYFELIFEREITQQGA